MNFKKMTLADKKALYEKAMWAYHNEQRQIITDKEFDKLEDLIREEDPTWDKLSKTGVRTFDRRLEVELKEFMPSLEKFYPEAIQKGLGRIDQNRAIVMDKLDGTSLQLRYKDGKPYSLTTRGDGTRGRDVSYFLPALIELKKIPEKIYSYANAVLRLEGVIKKATFDSKWSVAALGEKDGQDNARQLANGVFLRKEIGPELADIDLKVLGVYGKTIDEGLKWAENYGFDTVFWEYASIYPAEYLSFYLKHRCSMSEYEMDGLVITDKDFVLTYDTADKPKKIWAFKVNEDDSAHEVEVLDIEYAKTRTGRISIVARIPPTPMDGVVVERVTVHNAAWMNERGIGPGAIIKVLRSGKVIPKIVDVVSPGEFKAPPWPYKMDGRFYVVAEKNRGASSSAEMGKDVAIAQIRFFVTTMGIQLLAEKTIEKLYDIGLVSVADYMNLMCQDIEGMRIKLCSAGLTDGQAFNIIEELIRALSSKNKPSLKKLMVASGCMEIGIGERKLTSLENAGISMDALLSMSDAEIEKHVMPIDGWQAKTVEALTVGIRRFEQWLESLQVRLTTDGSLPVKEKKSNVLAGKKICFTGYRSQEQSAIIESNGGEVAIEFSGSVDVLLYKVDGRISGKVAKAGDRAMTWEQFVEKYGLEGANNS